MPDYPITGEPTPFSEIFDRFLGKITDDMYFENDGVAEWTKQNTIDDLLNIFNDSIVGFEFPRFPLYDFDIAKQTYNCHLTSEEINIIAILMYNTWLQRQVASIENTRMKYSGSEYKFSSQANHLDKLMKLKQEAERQSIHMQRLYKRRKLIDGKGSTKSNWSTLMEVSALDD